MNKTVILLFLALGTMGLPGQALAQEEHWQFELTPTFWAAGINIDSNTVSGREASADVDFGDIFNNLDFGGAIQLEAWRGQWGLIVSDLYLDLGLEGGFKPRIGPKVDADLDLRLNLLEVALARQFGAGRPDEQEEGQNKFIPKLFIEPLGGLRYGFIKERIDLQVSFARLPSIGEATGTFEDSDWWIEVFGGARLKYWFSPSWTVVLRGDIGGIKAGDETVFTWNVYAGLDYRPWKSMSVKLGYKVYDFNYEQESGENAFELDAMMHGPAIGLTIFF
jgi:hypothetical protein